MHRRRLLNLAILVMVVFSLVVGGLPVSAHQPSAPAGPAAPAAPISAVDQTKVPHYFGPYPNWANSPIAMADATVTINGAGTGATAVATVGANGVVTGITVTSPGSGYGAATTVDIAGIGTGATATAAINPGGSVVAVNVGLAGGGYTAPVVAIDPATTTATAVAYGGVDAVTLITGNIPGVGMPTVSFDGPDDPNGIQATGHAVCADPYPTCQAAPNPDGTPVLVTVVAVTVDNPGSGYAAAPGVVVRDGTQFKPIRSQALKAGTAARAQVLAAQQEGPLTNKAVAPAVVGQIWPQTATISIQNIVVTYPGTGYAGAPLVAISDATGIGSGASATAVVDTGAITGITVTAGGSGYITTGMKKFQDGLPGLTPAGANNLGQYIPVGAPDQTTFSTANGHGPDADYYVIALVQHRERMSSSLSASGVLMREYVQLSTTQVPGKQVALMNDLMDGTSVPALMPDGTPAVGVDNPHYLGPVIVANKDRPVRIVFYNLLPTGAAGNLFLPVDATMMGSGMGPMAMAAPVDAGSVMDMVRNPMCTDNPQAVDAMGMPLCFQNNRATLHLHGGTTPWISDGTAHQWITPANETTPWPQGVSVSDVPDMVGAGKPAGVPDCSAATDGCQTFYYTNQQSARLLFYHDHAWGITRLNVYAGEAAGYVITDATDQKLFGATGLFPDLGVGTPLVIQDRTFVPGSAQLAQQDPTWDSARWGGFGNLWYHHVYMPAQNPGDPSGMSSFGRWMYGPWFWPPAGTAPYQPIANPYYNMDPATGFTTPLATPCNLDVPSTWQYQTDPFCEPQLIPATPNLSVGMEQFNDTPIVNGTAYPTVTLDPKSYRLRLLNASNDRFWNLQWYVADPNAVSTDLNGQGLPIGGTEVALKAAEVAAAQLDPNVVPTPDTTISPVGPSWIQIGSEGGFLPAPTVVPNQPITWITDPTRFDVGNVDKHAMLLAPAERADVIVDFSAYAGQTLILYNDAPAAFPARVSSYDYYTGGPDLSPAGAPSTLPGYGPNTRTIMQVKIAAGTPAAAFNLTALNNAFKHHADGSGVFESGQHPIIVGQAAYNSAYGTNFAASSWCNAAGGTQTRCDGLARISEQGGDLFGFNTLKAPTAKMSIKLEPKALHDEMNSASFDEFGRMTANLGLEAVPANPAAQNIILYPFVNPQTELIDGTNLPSAGITVTPISSAADGTQIWKMTHNGVDTHPIHFHLFDVQVLNRVTWDNIIIPTEPSELGWKDTVRISPLEDTIVALRPVVPSVPFEVPNSVRMLNPMMPAGDTSMFNPVDIAGNPTANIVNQLVNFGWEYVYHCHILSHEEMDMMRPVTLALPPNKPDGLTYAVSGNSLTLTWNDNSINETAFVVQRNGGAGWVNLPNPVLSPLGQPNTHGQRTYVDTTYNSNMGYQYRVVAENTVGYGGEFPSLTVQSMSDATVGAIVPPAAPSNLVATLVAATTTTDTPRISLTWNDNSLTEANFVLERSVNGGAWAQIATPAGSATTGSRTYVDVNVQYGTRYQYRIAAVNAGGTSTYALSNVVNVPAQLTVAPNLITATAARRTLDTRVTLAWGSVTGATGFVVQRARDSAFTTQVTNFTVNTGGGAFGGTYRDTIVRNLPGGAPGTQYWYRVYATNAAGPSPYSNVRSIVTQ